MVIYYIIMNVPELCVDMLYMSFNSELDENNYHDIVKCLRKLKDQIKVEDLKPYYIKYKYPETYDPFLIIDKLRFAYIFGKFNQEIDDICNKILNVKVCLQCCKSIIFFYILDYNTNCHYHKTNYLLG